MNKVEIKENILSKNEEDSAALNRELTQKNNFFINILGSPGAGKTTFLQQLIPMLPKKAFVIEGDIQSDIDTQMLQSLGVQAVQINTFGACHLETPQIRAALPQDIENSFIFVENIGNLVCPAEFLIGEHIKVLISPVTEGSDKPYKYPLAFEVADIIIINKTDLLPYVEFDEDYFTKGVRLLNKNAPIIKVCTKNGSGVAEVYECVTKIMNGK
jgi:hydrogenase nickel incorporation protein HypB